MTETEGEAGVEGGKLSERIREKQSSFPVAKLFLSLTSSPLALPFLSLFLSVYRLSSLPPYPVAQISLVPSHHHLNDSSLSLYFRESRGACTACEERGCRRSFDLKTHKARDTEGEEEL